jgi:hypothetical protein
MNSPQWSSPRVPALARDPFGAPNCPAFGGGTYPHLPHGGFRRHPVRLVCGDGGKDTQSRALSHLRYRSDQKWLEGDEGDGGEESAPNRGSGWKIEMKLAKFWQVRCRTKAVERGTLAQRAQPGGVGVLRARRRPIQKLTLEPVRRELGRRGAIKEGRPI